MLNGKEWYKSKTIWFNVVYVLLVIFNTVAAQVGYSSFEPSPEVVSIAGVIANLILRFFFTEQPIIR